MVQYFDPNSDVVKICMQAVVLSEQGKLTQALSQLQVAWEVHSDDYDKFLLAYHFALVEREPQRKIEWFKKSLEFAGEIRAENVESAYPSIYRQLAQVFEKLGEVEEAQIYEDLVQTASRSPQDSGPFYHGSKADLKVGELLIPGRKSNYQSELKMNHIYFTANAKTANLAAALAQGPGEEKVYVVDPTGDFEDDPNVTDKKFPGNLTRSYRSQEPLRIIAELKDWQRLDEAQRQEWFDKLDKNQGEIIN